MGLAASVPGVARAAAPEGQLTWGLHVSVASTWLDPAETQGIITPYMVLYALHDAMVKDLPGKTQAPCLAESWSTSEDDLIHEFVLRPGVKFHDGEPVTAEDVKFSFERYHGTSHALAEGESRCGRNRRSAACPIQAEGAVARFSDLLFERDRGRLDRAEEICRKGRRRGVQEQRRSAPGRTNSCRSIPGVELVLEAFDGYWRKTPSVKRLVMKVIPDEATRAAALKAGEIDIAYSIRGELAEEVQQTPGLALKPVVLQAPNWLYFPEQWDPKSPWSKLQVRQAANLAIDREGMSKALFLGYCKITNNAVVPYTFDYYWQPPDAVYDPAKARKLMAEAGYPNGFDAGLLYCDAPTRTWPRCRSTISRRSASEPACSRSSAPGSLPAMRRRNMSAASSRARAARSATRRPGWRRSSSRAAPSPMAAIPISTSCSRSRPTSSITKKRTEILHKMQQLVHEKAIYAPIWQLGFINAVGPRVGESAFGLIAGFAYTAPFEDITIKS